MVCLFLCPICKQLVNMQNVYDAFEYDTTIVYGRACSICTKTLIEDKKTLVIEEINSDKLTAQEFLILNDKQLKHLKKRSPEDKTLIVPSGYLASIGYFKGIYFGHTRQ